MIYPEVDFWRSVKKIKKTQHIKTCNYRMILKYFILDKIRTYPKEGLNMSEGE